MATSAAEAATGRLTGRRRGRGCRCGPGRGALCPAVPERVDGSPAGMNNGLNSASSSQQMF